MAYIPSTEPRLRATEAALTTLTRAVIALYGAVLDVASETTDSKLKKKLLDRADEISPLIDKAIEQITSEQSPK